MVVSRAGVAGPGDRGVRERGVEGVDGGGRELSSAESVEDIVKVKYVLRSLVLQLYS
jgi:hypothetical protein